MSHILKLSQAKDQLAREAERGKRAAEVFPPNLLVQHRPAHTVGPVNGWYALGGPLIGRATTLAEAGCSRPDPGTRSAIVLEELFLDGLGHVYADGQAEPAEPLDSFAFTPYRQQCILQVLDELTEALERDDGGGLGQEATAMLVRDVQAFVTERRLPNGMPHRAIPQRPHTPATSMATCMQATCWSPRAARPAPS